MITRREKETIIVFNEADEEASIFTYNAEWQDRLQNVLEIAPIMENGKGGKEYLISKDRIRMPLRRKSDSAT